MGTGEPEYTILGIFSKHFSDVSLHFNLGPTIVEEGADLLNYFTALEWSVTDELNLVGEIFGTTTYEGAIDDNALSGLVGFTYVLKENVVWDVGVTTGISDADPDLTVTTGMTVVFGGP